MLDSLKIKALLSVLGIAGVTGGLFAAGVLHVPGVGMDDRGDWGETTEDSIEIISTGYVNNQNSFGLNISSLDVKYRLKMNNVMLAEGGKEGLNIRAESNQSVPVNTQLSPEKIPEWWVRHIRNGERSKLEVPISAEINLLSYPVKVNGFSYTDSIETDLESRLDQAVSQIKGNYSWSPTGAEITRTDIEVKGGSAKFGKVTDEHTNLVMELDIHNPNSYVIPMPQLNGGLQMNDIRIAEWEANDVEILNSASETTIAPGETENVKLQVKMENKNMDDWFVSHASRGEKSNGSVNIVLGFDIAGQTLKIPSSEGMKCGFQFRTGILVDNQKSNSSFNGCEFPGTMPDTSPESVEPGTGLLDQNEDSAENESGLGESIDSVL